MDVKIFVERYREAFTLKAELPVAVWYSDDAPGVEIKTQGCMFKAFPAIKDGTVVSFSAETLGCGGGKFYSGFAPMNSYIPNFVSNKEHYKDTPASVEKCIDEMDVQLCGKKYLNMARVDALESFDGVEGLVFFVTPDVLSGLCSWVFWDNNSDDAVSTQFNSGCAAVITRMVNENRRDGQRAFLGLFDPSVRPYFGSNILSLAVPMSRFKTMYHTMTESCILNSSHAWDKVKARIGEG